MATFFSAGLLTAFLSLIFSIFLIPIVENVHFYLKNVDLILLFGVLIEEFSRLIVFYFLISFLDRTRLSFSLICFSVAGIGFAVFEYILVNLGFYGLDFKDNLLSYFPALLIHIINSVIIGMGLLAARKKQNKIFFIVPLIFTLFSVIIHLVFNMLAVIYNL
ncbi:MAG: PrsW family glutamic-type intramembrane protease [Candidatus Moraniibacteriota bacterium]